MTDRMVYESRGFIDNEYDPKYIVIENVLLEVRNRADIM